MKNAKVFYQPVRIKLPTWEKRDKMIDIRAGIIGWQILWKCSTEYKMTQEIGYTDVQILLIKL